MVPPKTKISRQVRINQPLLPILVGGMIILRLVTGYDGWLILAVGLGSAWLLAYFWAKRLAAGMDLDRESRFGWGQVGDLLEERFVLRNQSSLPMLWVEVEDQGDLPGYSGSLAISLGGGQSLSWRRGGACSQRGLFHQGPTRLYTSDPFGIYRVQIDDPRQRKVLVTPPLIPLPHILVAASGWSGEGRPRPDAPERTISAASTRPYTPGDSLRYIHWRTTARRQNYSSRLPGNAELYVRTFEGTPAGHWWIVLDLNQAVQVGRGEGSTLEAAVILAASLADQGLRLGKPVGLAATGSSPSWLAPRSGENQRWMLLQALAIAQPGHFALAPYLQRLPLPALKGSSLVLITPDPDPEWMAALLHLTLANITPTVLLLDSQAFGGNRSTAPALTQLQDLGVHSYSIHPSLFDRPEARPGRRGQDDLRVTPSGRAIRLPGRKAEEWRTLD